MNKIIFIILTLLSFNLAAQVESKVELMKLNEGEMKLIEKRGAATSELKHRYFELMSERIGFIREKENKNYLGLKEELRRSKAKDEFFNDSKSYYEKARSYGLDLITKHPRYEHKAEVYYTLALNARDFTKSKEEETFFLSALKSSHEQSPVAHQSHIGLAEFYYNEKKFEEAHKYYRLVIQDTQDNWLPKHLYNMAWCELKLRKFNSSIELMKKAYELSSNPGYLSSSEDILNHIGMFYILADHAQDAIDFYIQKKQRTAYYLYKLSKGLAEKGQYALTHKTITQALELAKEDKKEKDLPGDIRLFQLEFYRNFAQNDLFIESAKSMSEETISSTQRDEATQRIREFAGYLQIRLTENAKKNIRNFDPTHLERVLKLFDVLKKLDLPKAYQYAYYQGETNFSVRRFNEAIVAYEESLSLSTKAQGQEEEARKAIASLLSLLDEANLKAEEKIPHYIIAYSQHIRLWPKDEKSRAIYPKLFSLEKPQNFNRAKEVFEQFIQNFPEDKNIQQELCLALMDDNAEKKDIAALAQWTEKMDKGFLSFSQEKIEKAVGILGHLLFDSIEKKSDRKEAIQDYINLYNNPRYPQKIKAKSAFNASSLYLEEDDIKNSLLWFKNALGLYPSDDLKDLRPVIVAMSLKFALRLDLHSAKEILEAYLSKTQKAEQQDLSLWEHYFLFSLTLNKNKEAQNLYKDKIQLSENEQKKIQIAYAKKLYLFGDLQGFLSIAEKTNDKELNTFLNSTIERLYHEKLIGKEKLTDEKYAKFPFIQKMSEVEAYEKELRTFEKKRLKIATKFKETHFNWALEEYLQKIKETVDHGQWVLKRTDREGAIALSRLIPEVYNISAHTLENLEYEKVPKDMRDSFKEVILKMADNFKIEGQNLKLKILETTSKTFTYAGKELAFQNLPKDLEHKVENFAIKNLEYDKDCELMKKPDWEKRENAEYWLLISGCQLSLGNINSSMFYAGLAKEFSKKSEETNKKLSKLQGALAAHQADWDEAHSKFAEANSDYNFMLLGFTFGRFKKVQEYYESKDIKDPIVAEALELLKMLKGMSYAKN